MERFIPEFSFALGVVLAGIVAALVYRLRDRDFKHTIAAYDRLLDKRDAEYESLKEEKESILDRLHATRNLPPGKVDMTEERQERREKEQKREAEGPQRPHRISRGPYDTAVSNMLAESKRQREA